MAVLPVHNIITVPDAVIYLKISMYQKLTGKAPKVDDRVTLIVTKEDLHKEELQNDSFYPIGIAGTVTEINENGFMVIALKNRVDIKEITVFMDHSIDIVVEKRRDIDDLDPIYAEERLHALKDEITKVSDDFAWGNSMHGLVDSWTKIGEIAGAFSPWVNLDNEERYALLAEDSQRKRFDMIEKMLYENLEIIKVRTRARSAQEEDYQKMYKESAIKKQMEYLQKELDEMHPENVSDLRKLEIKLEESKMNETARAEGRRILNRLKSEGQNSAESGMLTDYLDLLTSLPWEKEEGRAISLSEAEKVLEADHFGLEKVKKRIIEQIAVMQLTGKQAGSILLFVGAPGTGKTSIGQSIAKALGREYVRVSLGGVRDEADIRGHRRTYIGSMPGRIIDGIRKSGVSNPVMVLDEVDKLSQSYNGDPASALLEVLDPEQNFSFTDHYLNVPYDLSDVFFICTANTIDTIPEPLLNRMEMIRFEGYTPIEKHEIAKRHLLPKAMEAVGLTAEQLEVTEDAIDRVISEYTREAGVRGLKKRMDLLCRSAAVRLVRDAQENGAVMIPDTEEAAGPKASSDEAAADGQNAAANAGRKAPSEGTGGVESAAGSEKAESVVNAAANPAADTKEGEKPEGFAKTSGHVKVDTENLSEFMDMHPIRRKNVPASAKPGVVTGLAWTSVGGDILYIETMLTKGDGKTIITGQLGDVMKESAQIAVSLVKNMFPEKAKLFKENDLHIHVPDGATPKDGPSAGITLTTALSSLINGVAVPPTVAMTGEVSLQGGVNPIGGLPETLMAAQRTGVKKVFIPKDNVDDLKDVAQEVRDVLEIIPVDDAADVLKALGIMDAHGDKKSHGDRKTREEKKDREAGRIPGEKRLSC